MDKCPFVITKGSRKGEVCGKASKSERIKYCKDHIRNVGVQKELLAEGIDVTGERVENSVEGKGMMEMKGVKQIDAKYNKPIVKVEKEEKKEKKKTFITAFESNIDEKMYEMREDEKMNMDDIYDEIELEEEEEEENKIIEEQRRVIENQQKQILQQQRRITSMFTMKQIMYVGLNTVAGMIENCSPEKLEGYQMKVGTSPAINEIMDEMSADMDEMIGFSEMPAVMRLALTMGALASATVVEKSGVYVREVKEEVVGGTIPEGLKEEKNFEAAYKE